MIPPASWDFVRRPQRLLTAFAKFGGVVRLSDQAAKAQCADQEACFDFNGAEDGTIALIVADNAATSQNLVKGFGHFLIQLLADAAPIATQPGTFKINVGSDRLVTSRQAIADALMRDLSSSLSLDLGALKRLTTKGVASALRANIEKGAADLWHGVSPSSERLNFERRVFAEAFASFYCNTWSSFNSTTPLVSERQPSEAESTRLFGQTNTRALMAAMLPRTAQTFAALAPALSGESIGVPLALADWEETAPPSSIGAPSSTADGADISQQLNALETGSQEPPLAEAAPQPSVSSLQAAAAQIVSRATDGQAGSQATPPDAVDSATLAALRDLFPQNSINVPSAATTAVNPPGVPTGGGSTSSLVNVIVNVGQLEQWIDASTSAGSPCGLAAISGGRSESFLELLGVP